MSSSTNSYNELEDAFISDANFKVDISQKMKVPDKISFKSSDLINGDRHNNWAPDNFSMHVPERILVVGQNQHVGTRAPPREIAFDNSLIQTEPYPGDMRVATPPRQLTLDKYPFPLVDETEENEKDRIPVANKQKLNFDLNDTTELNISRRESTPPIGMGGDSLTPAEEVHHLRRQMARMNRRIMALELENLNRLQKEKIMYGLGIAYFLLKAIIWLNRN